MIDSQNMIGALDDFPNQINKGFFELANKIKIEKKDFKNILFAGMGGSGLPGDIVKTLLRDISKIPVFVQKTYGLPKFVDKDTLFFAVSYSGNTEETLDAYKTARGKSCTTVVVTSGGSLRKMAESDKKPMILVPSGMQARLAVGYQFFTVLRVLQDLGIVKDFSKEVKEVAEKLRNPDFKMKGEELATKLVEKVPIVYASDTLWVVAEILKESLNESSKVAAFYNYFPELNHDEMSCFETPKANFHVIMIREERCHRQIAKRFKLTKDIISKKASTTEIVIKGDTHLLNIFTAIYIGFWAAYFLALKYGVDPSPTKLQEEFKKKL